MSKIILKDQLIQKLTDSLKSGVTEVSTQKTVKYFTGASDYDARLKDVCTTIVGLMSTFGSVVTVNGEIFSVSDYKVPSKLVDLLNAGRIYGSSDAVMRVKPMFQVEPGLITLTPGAFNKFFTDFNANQGDSGEKIALSEGYVRATCTLDDFQYIEDKSGNLRKFHETGFPIELCALIGIEIEEIAEYLTEYSKPSTLGIGLWLFK